MNQNLFTYISNAFTARDAVFFVIGTVLMGITICAFLRFFLMKEIRLFLNRRRPIMIFKSTDQPMEIETKILRGSGLFTIKEDPVESHLNTDMIKNHGLIIIGYTPNMLGFPDMIHAAKQHKIPVIVYASYEALQGENKQILSNYSYHSICNLPLRLVNDVFTVLSTFPHDKK